MKVKHWIAFILCICLSVGCASRGSDSQVRNTAETEQNGYIGMAGGAVQPDYEFAAMKPGVLTDQIGYEPGGDKVVLFRGNGLSDSFSVMDAESGNTVYSGTIEYAGLDEQTGEKISAGVFTGLVENGTYYIVTPVIGESYRFRIGESLYDEVFRSSCLAFEELWETEAGYQGQNLKKDAQTIGNLLIAFEYYTGIFTDDLGTVDSGNGIPDVLDILKKRVDEVMTLAPEELTYEQLSCYVGILAQFSQDEKKFDARHSAECLLKAQEAFRLLEKKNLSGQDAGYYFYAAAQLYRATGYASYHTVIRNYLAKQGERTGSMDFYGKMAYMSCKYTVDTALCNDMITELMSQVEEISSVSSKNPYLVCSDQLQDICDQMVKFSVVNYVITNHEYVTVQENHLHYLLGRNAEGISYISGAGQRQSDTPGDSITADSYQNSALVLMMCEIILEERSGS